MSTRPVADNGLGLTIDQAAWKLRKLKRFFRLQPDTPTIFSEWEHLGTGVSVEEQKSVADQCVHLGLSK